MTNAENRRHEHTGNPTGELPCDRPAGPRGSSSSFELRHSTFNPRPQTAGTRSFRMPALAAFALAAVCGCVELNPAAATRPADADADWSIVRTADGFDLDEPSSAWTFRTPPLWRIAVDGDRRFLQMAFPPKRPLLPGVRRPQEYAVYNKFEFRSFSLTCRVRIESEPTVKGRDACIIFGRRDDTHFYYAHLSNYTDAFHNNLIRVDGADRTPLLPADPARKPAIADQNWHLVDVVRDVNAGTIKVYIDRDKSEQNASPIFEATDRTYASGFVALGSSDDHAGFGRFGIEGQARPPTIPLTVDPTPPPGKTD